MLNKFMMSRNEPETRQNDDITTLATRYKFKVIGQAVWIEWETENEIHNLLWCRCGTSACAEETCKMLNYAAYCQNASTIEICPIC